MTIRFDDVHDWDTETDVLVIGHGYAGAAAAIAAADAGARVILTEKMPHLGGLSVTSGGGIAITNNADGAFNYLRTTCGGRTPDEVLRAFADGMAWVREWVTELATAVGAQIDERAGWSGATYPFPGHEWMGAVKIAPIAGFSGYPWAHGLRGGARLTKVLEDNVALRPAIVTWFSAPAVDLVATTGGEVAGAVIRREGQNVRVRTRRGVILACGGFEFHERMKQDFFQALPVYGITGKGNTGDGIEMAQQLGARLWHMWHFHGGYGFKYDGFDIAFRHVFSGPRVDDKPMPWIVVDQYGRRFMNEYQPALQDTAARSLEYFDPERQEYPRSPSYLIFDEAGRQRGPVAFPILIGERRQYEWSEDNLKEVAQGWIWRADTPEELAAEIRRRGQGKMDGTILRATLDQWNDVVDSGADDPCDRPPGTRCPVRQGPFYAMEVWPVVSNTQGGPAHDAEQRILHVDGTPIPRLYAAGELGSLFGHLYLEGGNIAECFVGGRISGRNAAAEPDLMATDLPKNLTQAGGGAGNR